MSITLTCTFISDIIVSINRKFCSVYYLGLSKTLIRQVRHVWHSQCIHLFILLSITWGKLIIMNSTYLYQRNILVLKTFSGVSYFRYIFFIFTYIARIQCWIQQAKQMLMMLNTPTFANNFDFIWIFSYSHLSSP